MEGGWDWVPLGLLWTLGCTKTYHITAQSGVLSYASLLIPDLSLVLCLTCLASAAG